MDIPLTQSFQTIIERRLAVNDHYDERSFSSSSVQILDDMDAELPDLATLLAVAEEEVAYREVHVWNAELRAKIHEQAMEMIRLGIRPAPEVCP